MPEGARWGVVGGGMLGMTLAWRLAQQGHRVTLFESQNQLGGLADAWKLGDVVWDRHYHVILLSDSYLRRLLEDLRLADQLCWKHTQTGFFTAGRLHPFSNAWDFFRFAPLRWNDKLRLAMTIWYASKIRDWRRLEAVYVTDWLRRLSGRRTYETIWLPLLRAKLGDNYRQTSAAFIWATIRRLYAARRTGLKREMFGYVSGGYDHIVRRFASRLEEAGVDVRLGAAVRQVVRDNGQLRLSESGSSERFDRVVVTSPAPLASQICPQLSPAEHERLRDVCYQGIVCASLLLKRPLSPYYVTNITDPEIPFTGIVEMSSLVDRRNFGGHSLVYLPKYVPSGDPLLDESVEQLRPLFLEGLRRMHPAFRAEDLLAFRISKARYVCALSTLHYSRHVPSVTTSVPNLYVVNSAQIVNGTLNVNETIKLAHEALDRWLAPVDPRPESP